MFKFNLGAQVKHTGTGVIGTIFARAEYAEGAPRRYIIEEIGTPNWWWADEDNLELCYGE